VPPLCKWLRFTALDGDAAHIDQCSAPALITANLLSASQNRPAEESYKFYVSDPYRQIPLNVVETPFSVRTLKDSDDNAAVSLAANEAIVRAAVEVAGSAAAWWAGGSWLVGTADELDGLSSGQS